MSISVTKVSMSVADLTDDVLAEMLTDCEANFDLEAHKAVALIQALTASRRGMRNIIALYDRTSKEAHTLRREAAVTFATHQAETQRLLVVVEAAKRHALKMRIDAARELQAAEEFEAALTALATLALEHGIPESAIDECILLATD